MSKGMRILYLSPLDYLSLSEEDQRQFTDDVQEAYDKIADRYFGIDDSLQESTKQIAKPPAEDKSNKSRSDKLKDRNAEIVKDYAEGYSYAELMKKYSLSEPSISTIIRKAQQ
jgi:DNA-binding NarL/FixJ family response regulator